MSNLNKGLTTLRARLKMFPSDQLQSLYAETTQIAESKAVQVRAQLVGRGRVKNATYAIIAEMNGHVRQLIEAEAAERGVRLNA